VIANTNSELDITCMPEETLACMFVRPIFYNGSNLSLRILLLSPVVTFQTLLHTHLFICYRRHAILAIKSSIKCTGEMCFKINASYGENFLSFAAESF